MNKVRTQDGADSNEGRGIIILTEQLHLLLKQTRNTYIRALLLLGCDLICAKGSCLCSSAVRCPPSKHQSTAFTVNSPASGDRLAALYALSLSIGCTTTAWFLHNGKYPQLISISKATMTRGLPPTGNETISIFISDVDVISLSKASIY